MNNGWFTVIVFAVIFAGMGFGLWFDMRKLNKKDKS